MTSVIKVPGNVITTYQDLNKIKITIKDEVTDAITTHKSRVFNMPLNECAEFLVCQKGNMLFKVYQKNLHVFTEVLHTDTIVAKADFEIDMADFVFGIANQFTGKERDDFLDRVAKIVKKIKAESE